MVEVTRTTRPIFARLPEPLQIPPDLPEGENSIADSITLGADKRLADALIKAEEFAKLYCNPTYCPTQYLDWLASVLLQSEFVWWDAAWTRDQKVRLLNNIPYIRARLGSVTLFNNFLIPNFDLDARLEPDNGWVVGDATVATPLAAQLGATSFDWNILYAERYTERSPEYNLILMLRDQFLPCWADYDLIPVPNEYF